MSTPQIIGATWLVPVDTVTLHQGNAGENGWLEDAAVLINNGCIQAVAGYDELCRLHPGANAEFHSNHILLPGLINCHGHAGMSLLRGFADDKPLHEWLEQHIWPQEQRWVGEEFVEVAAELGIAEMLLAGTTTFSDMYFFPATTAKVAERAGVRAQLNFPIVEFANNWATDADQHIALGLEAFDQWRQHERIDIGFAPHAPYTVSDKTFSRVVMLAEEIDARIQIHLHETEKEVNDSLAEYGLRPIERLQQLSVLSARTQAVHLTQLNERDIETLAQNSTSAIHCPSSNLKLASGYCDIGRLLENNIKVGLGTDSAASNNTLSTFDSLRMTALLAKHAHSDAAAVDAEQALRLATLGGAEALGMGEITGSISKGKRADLIAVDCSQPGQQPVYNPASQLVYTDCSNAVTQLWVDGEQLVKDRKLQTLQQEQIIERCQHWQQKIQAG